jgi:polyhydroxyalkanoate synthesis regulator phasin
MARRTRREEAAEAVRTAVDRTVQATVGQAQFTRERAQEVVDELASTAGRVRDALDELRIPVVGDDVRDLRARVEALEARVAELETARGPRATGTRRAAGKSAGGSSGRASGRGAAGSG